MSRIRRSFEQGHQRKFLVIIDDSKECDRAVYYAARRAKRTGGQLVMLRITGGTKVESQWLGVEAMIKAEALQEAEVLMRGWADKVKINFGLDPQQIICDGHPVEQIQKVMLEDEDIAILILASSSGADGPGPLIDNLSVLMSGDAPVPVTIVPDTLSDEEINALA